jgi:hypothetical protein
LAPFVDGTLVAPGENRSAEDLSIKQSDDLIFRTAKARNEEKRVWLAQLVPNPTRRIPALPLERAVRSHVESSRTYCQRHEREADSA